jgi:hypothetical protein
MSAVALLMVVESLVEVKSPVSSDGLMSNAVPCPFGVWIDAVKEVRLVPPLNVAPPKLPVLALKTAGVALHAAEVPAAVKLPLLSAKADDATVNKPETIATQKIFFMVFSSL